MEEVFEKTENQLEKVEPVAKALEDMGAFYKKITTKLTKDGICYISGLPIKEDDAFDIIQVPDSKVKPGMIAFVSVLKKLNI